MPCPVHRPRYRRLWRLPSVRTIGTTATVTLAGAALSAFWAPMVVPAVILALGVTGIGGYVRRCRARIAVEARMVRALIQTGPGCPGEVELPQLSAAVRAEADSAGVTRIHADSWLDAVRALGYVLGRDRGFQMDLMRRTASGRLAQVWGRTALPVDRTYRPLDLGRTAARARGTLDAPERDLLTAFTEGVNAALERHGPPFECRFLSYRFQPWTAEDSLLIALLLFHSLSWNEPAKRAEAVTRRALPDAVAEFFLPGAAGAHPPLPGGLASLRTHGEAAADVVLVDAVAAGSNCWVRGGLGTPVLACDPHLPLTMPNLLYEVDMRWPGGRLRGLVPAGLPVVLAGGNGHIVWGVTNLGADVLDLVQVGTSDAGAVPGGLTTRKERIRVRGLPDVLLDIAGHGTMPVSPVPLLSERVAVRWTGHDPRSCDLKFQRLAQASSVEESIAVIDGAQGIALNVLVADGTGRMAHLATGLIPRRPDGTSCADYGYLAGPERPRLVDPPDEILVSANDAALPERPFRIGYDLDPGHRARRVRQRLAEVANSGPAMRVLQHDLAAQLYLPYRDLAVSALAGRGDGLAEMLAAWDGTADAQSRAFGVIVRLRQILARRVLSPYLSVCRDYDPHYQYLYQSIDRPLLAILHSEDPSLLPREAQAGGWAAFLAGCTDLAVADLGGAAGRSGPPPWGSLNRVGLNHPLEGLAPWSAALLGIAPRPQPGALHSVRTCAPGFGAVGRAVLSPGADGFASFELPGGQSGHPLSVHFDDRHEEWLNARPRAGPPRRVLCTYVLTPGNHGREHRRRRLAETGTA